MGPEQRQEALSAAVHQHPLLAGLPNDLQVRLIERARLRELAPGEAITREGSAGTRFYILLEGSARVSRARSDGGQERIGRLRPGAIFGAMSLVDGSPRAATIAATAPSLCLELPAELLNGAPRTLDGRLALALRELLATSFSEQLRAANRQLYFLSRQLEGAEDAANETVDPEAVWLPPE